MKSEKARLVWPFMKSFLSLTLALVLFATCRESSPLPRQTLIMNGKHLQVEVADTEERCSMGLMYRKSLPRNRGMLFVYPRPTTQGFWMKNTRIPLSIAFIDEEFRIIDIQEMEPLDQTVHNPPGPYIYALEVNQGWFKENSIYVGDYVKFGPISHR